MKDEIEVGDKVTFRTSGVKQPFYVQRFDAEEPSIIICTLDKEGIDFEYRMFVENMIKID